MDKGSYITMQGKTLIIGASGQIGIELTLALRAKYGNDAIIASDIRKPNDPIFDEGPFEVLNVLDKPSLEAVIEKHNISYVYQLAALLSATSEKNPEKAWDLNMNGLFHILDIAKAGKILLRKFLDDIKATETKLNGRINTEIVLLKAA